MQDMPNIRTYIGLVAIGATVTVTALPWDCASTTKPVADQLGWTPLPTKEPFPLANWGGMAPIPEKRIFGRGFYDQLCGLIDGNWGEVVVPLLFSCRL